MFKSSPQQLSFVHTRHSRNYGIVTYGIVTYGIVTYIKGDFSYNFTNLAIFQ